MAVSRSRDEDQQLGPTVDGRLRLAPDPATVVVVFDVPPALCEKNA